MKSIAFSSIPQHAGTGYEQVRSVAAALAGDWTEVGEVRLVLPETGVCTTERPDTRPLAALATTRAAADGGERAGLTSTAQGVVCCG